MGMYWPVYTSEVEVTANVPDAPLLTWFNSLSTGRSACDFNNAIVNIVLLIDILRFSSDDILDKCHRAIVNQHHDIQCL